MQRHLAWLLPLLTAISIQSALGAPPTVEGFWIARVDGMDSFVPCGDGKRAWVWKSDTPGLYLADEFGNILNANQPVFTQAFLNTATNQFLMDLVKSDDLCLVTWIIKGNGEDEIHAIKHEKNGSFTESGPLKIPFGRVYKGDNYQTFIDDYLVAVSSSHAWVWVSSRPRGLLEVWLGADGRLEGRRRLENQRITAVIPTRKPGVAWVIAESSDRRYKPVYLIDAVANSEKVISSPTDNEYSITHTASSDGESLWLSRLKPGVTLFDRNGEASLILPHSNLWDVIPTPAGDTAWVTIELFDFKSHPDERPALVDRQLLLVDKKGNFLQRKDSHPSSGISPADEYSILGHQVANISPIHDGAYVWVQPFDKSPYVVRSDGTLLKGATLVQKRVDFNYLIPSPDATTAWAQPSLYSEARGIFFLHANGEPSKNLFTDSLMTRLFPTSGGKYALAIVDAPKDRSIYMLDFDGNITNGQQALLGKLPPGATPYLPVSPTRMSWHPFPGRGLYSFHSARESLTEAAVSLGTDSVHLGDTDGRIFHGSQPLDHATVSVALTWPGRSKAASVGGTVKVTMFESTPTGDVPAAVWTQTIDSQARLPLQWVRPFQWNVPYKLLLEYTDTQYGDNQGSRFQVTWSSVVFVLPWYRHPWFVTLYVYLGILGVLATLVRTSTSELAVSTWLPAGGWGSAMALALVGDAWLTARNVDGRSLALLLGVTAAGFVGAGLTWPPAFRLFARITPTKYLAPWVITLPWLRKRLYAKYTDELESWLRLEREKANDEQYISVAARWKDASSSSVESQPAAQVSEFLTRSPTARPNIFIESPGGSGKSALFRESVRLAIEAFRRNPRSPLPVIGSPAGDPPESMIERALGRHVFSPRLVRPQLAAGGFLLAIDDMVETTLAATTLDEFVRGELGLTTQLLLTSRPNDAFRRAIQSSRSWVLIEPLRLTEETLRTFVSGYGGERGGKARELSPQLKEVCRGPDNTYLPVLVRFALLAEDESTHGVAELYARAIRQLLKKKLPLGDTSDEQLIEEAADLCVETYWRSGSRVIAYRDQSRDRKQLLSRFLSASILVPVGGARLGDASDPREVKFFHDSIQSYLTARGLFRRSEWDSLAEAAGRPEFLDATGTSEVFQMCLHVFTPTFTLRATLDQHLRNWATQYDSDLRKKDIVDAVPSELQESFQQQFQTEFGAGAALGLAHRLCQGTNTGDLSALSRLYGRIAPLVYTATGARGRSWIQEFPFPWHRAEQVGLIRLLASAYRDLPAIEALGSKVGLDLMNWKRGRTTYDAWRGLLELASAQARVLPLIEHVLADSTVRAIHDRLRASCNLSA